MILKVIIPLLFTCFVATSAMESLLTKEFFFVNHNNQLPYRLLHLQSGVVAYGWSNSLSNPEPVTPQYALMNPQTGTVRRILQDQLASCNHTGEVTRNRLHYNLEMSSLVYYCTANNSLLIIDEQDFSVVDVIATQITAQFDETAISSDGSLVFVLGLTIAPSQLVQIDLSTRKLVSYLVLDKYLASGEVIDGFLSSNNETYVSVHMMSSYQMGSVTIYSFTQTDDSYELKNLSAISYQCDPTNINLPQLFSLGDYIITNNCTDVVALSKTGELVSAFTGVSGKALDESDIESPYDVAMVNQEQTQDLYIFYSNSSIYKYSFNGSAIASKEIGKAGDMQVAVGNQHTNDLLFTLNEDLSSFAITDLGTSQKIYESNAHANGFFLTNSTYVVVISNYSDLSDITMKLDIHDLRTSKPIATHLFYGMTPYLDEKTNNLYYLYPETSNSCGINKIDLTTGSSETLAIFPSQYSEACDGEITQVSPTANNGAELVIQMTGTVFYIWTQKYGMLTFYPLDSDNILGVISYDFDTTSLYFISSISPTNNTAANVTYYEYDATEQSFVQKESYQFNDVFSQGYLPIDNNQTIASTGDQFFSMLNLKTRSFANYTVPIDVSWVTSFHDTVGKPYYVVSAVQDVLLSLDDLSGATPYILDGDKLNPIPEANNNTVLGGAAGACSYWLMDAFMLSIAGVRFYNICPEQFTSIIQ